MVKYYYIHDKKLVGKAVCHSHFIYIRSAWEADREELISHYLRGYDPETQTNGNPHILIKIDEISKAEAERLINR